MTKTGTLSISDEDVAVFKKHGIVFAAIDQNISSLDYELNDGMLVLLPLSRTHPGNAIALFGLILDYVLDCAREYPGSKMPMIEQDLNEIKDTVQRIRKRQLKQKSKPNYYQKPPVN